MLCADVSSSPQSPELSPLFQKLSLSKLTPNTTINSSDGESSTKEEKRFDFEDFAQQKLADPFRWTPLADGSLLSDFECLGDFCDGDADCWAADRKTGAKTGDRRFSVVTPQCRTLLTKLRKRSSGTNLLFDNKSLSLESSREALEDYFGAFAMEFHDNPHDENLIKNLEEITSESQVSECNNPQPLFYESPMLFSHEPAPHFSTCVIPEQYLNKKMPYLVKKMRTGYLKFFDEKNNYGFISIFDEPNADVFVFGKEFVKSKIDARAISTAKGDPAFTLKFRVMYYIGRHGPSRKAVNIRL